MTLDSAAGTVVPRRQLGRHLRVLREQAGLSLREAGQRLETSASTMSRVENGETPVRSLSVEHACRAYGVTDPDLIRALMDLAKQTKAKDAENWLSSYTDGVVSENYALFVGLEASACSVFEYETDLIPGLLQTRAYAERIMRAERFTGSVLDPALLEQRLEVRLTRQLIFEREVGAPELSLVLSEGAVRRGVGGADVMAGQLAHLLEMNQRSNIEIRIMPLWPEHGGLTTGSFTLLDFPPKGPLIEPSGVYVDSYVGFFWTEDPDVAKSHRIAWKNLWATAWGKRQSVEFIEQQIVTLQAGA